MPHTSVEDMDEVGIVVFLACIRLATEDIDLVLPGSHGMARPSRRRRAHILEHVPSLVYASQSVSLKYNYQAAGELTRDFESSKILEILTIDAPATEDIHDIVYKRRRVAFTGNRNVTDAGQFGPSRRVSVVTPRVVIVILAVCAAKATVSRL
jgi:hypothetical protein